MTVTRSDSHIKLKFTSVKSCVSCCKLLCKWFECHVSKRPATQCDAGLSDSVSRPRFGSAALRSSAWAQAWAVLMHVASFVLQLRKLIWMILNVHLEISTKILESSIQTYTEYTFVHMVLDGACYHVGSREPVVVFFHAVCIGLWSRSVGPHDFMTLHDSAWLCTTASVLWCVPSRTTILWWAMPRYMSLSRSGTCSCAVFSQ